MPHAALHHWLLCLFALLCATGSRAAAQTTTPAGAPRGAAVQCENEPRCLRLIDQGYEASQQGRFDEAQRAYEQAYRQQPDPKILYNLARVLHKAARFSDSVKVYQRYLNASPDENDPLRRKAQQYLEQAQQEARRVSTTVEPTSQTEGRPIYKAWWLWTAIGVVAVGVAVGVGVGLASQQPDTSSAYVIRF